MSEALLQEDYEPSRALNVLRRCVAQNNLAHGLLLTGENLAILEQEAMILAGDLLDPLSQPPSPDHPVGIQIFST